MKHATLLGIAAVATIFGAAPALAQANRTFVSGHGSDSNPCSIAAPCRSFAQAITQTNAGGEIVVLDSAGYGSVTINKAISISNQDGVEAGVTGTLPSDGITVSAGASDVVNLRGLTLVGSGTTTSGITFTSGKSLNVDKCVIRDFTAAGISLQTISSGVNLTVSDTTVSNNFQGFFGGPAGAAGVTLARFHATGNGNAGIVVNPVGTGGVILQVVDSLFDNNNLGITATSGSGGPGQPFAVITVDNSTLSSNTFPAGNLTAIGAGSIITIGRSQFNNIGSGSTSSGGKIQSYGNNQGFGVMGNPTLF